MKSFKLQLQEEKDEEKKQASEKAEREFKMQVEKYDELGMTRSKRGQATLILGGIIIASLILGYFDIMPLADVLYSLIIYIPVLFFIYKGHRWAMYLGIILWTIEKGYQLIALNGKGVFMVLVWWLILVAPLYGAIKIENERKKRNKSDKQDNIQPVNTDENFLEGKRFCHNCGKKINFEGNFCKFCGNQLA
ncbi:MAG: hypothetical protein WC819_01990 [Parcubacteria group bacterium]|jgi:hypothetical protein